MSDQPTASVKNAVKRLPGLKHVLASRGWNRFRHWRVVHFQPRKNWWFTQVLRLPTQFDALVGPVLEFLQPSADEPLRVVVVGCSTGLEPVTIGAILNERVPGLRFRIDSYDIERSVLEIAQRGVYGADEVRSNPFATDDFIARVFDPAGDQFVVKPALRQLLRFAQADVLDPEFAVTVGEADIVFAQNFMFHLPRRANPAAFRNICSVLKQRAALFVEGMDLDLRKKLTRRAGLEPLGFGLDRIHAEARAQRAKFWPWKYMGLEPFDAGRRDALDRYATIYLRGAPRPTSHP